MSILHRRMETLEQASAELARHLSALELVDLRAQVARLAAVLMEEFGGPTQSEGACEMAVRLLATLQEEKRVLVGALRRIAPEDNPYEHTYASVDAKKGTICDDCGGHAPDHLEDCQWWLARIALHKVGALW